MRPASAVVRHLADVRREASEAAIERARQAVSNARAELEFAALDCDGEENARDAADAVVWIEQAENAIERMRGRAR